MFGWNRCGPVRPHLWEYAEGTLEDGTLRARVEQHLAGCARCRAEVAETRRAAAALTGFAALPAQSAERPANWESVRARLEAAPAEAPAPPPAPQPTRRPVLVPVLGTAFAAVAVGVATVAVSGLLGGDSGGRSQQVTYAVPSTYGAADRSPVRLSVDPVFTMLPPRGTFPLRVKVENQTGKAQQARLVVEVGRNVPGEEQRYEYEINVPAGETARRIVYPSLNAYYGSNMANVTVRGQFPTRSVGVPINYNYNAASGNHRTFGYVGDGVGVLAGKWRDRRPPEENSFYTVGYAKPEDAPDRAIGYDSIDYLVLGRGAERLRSGQWRAIRQWVLSGGGLILTDGGGAAYLNAPEAADLSPVIPATRSVRNSMIGATSLPPLSAPGFAFPITLADVKPGAHSLSQRRNRAGQERDRTPLALRRLGAGSVLYLGCDATTPEFRAWGGVEGFWTQVGDIARPAVVAKDLRTAAALSRPVATTGAAATATGDPFRVSLPSVATVLNFFAVYFLFAVPVTFVVLKRLRRMEWAWATGPVLAVVTAGSMALLTVNLYSAKLSRRTAGVLVGTATGEARFVGYTELFFPRAGSFRVAVPGAEEYELSIEDSNPNRGPLTPEGARRSLVTTDAGGELTARVDVANLAFRRIYHTQTLNLGGGVRGSVTPLPNGKWRVDVRNETDRTIENAALFLRVRSGGRRNGPRPVGPGGAYIATISIGTLKPGAEYRKAEASETDVLPWTSNGYLPLVQQVASVPSPVLLGQVSGEDLGPGIGQWVGDNASVTVAFDLPELVEEGGRP